MTRRNRLADLLRFYGKRPLDDDPFDATSDEREWIDVGGDDDGDDAPGAGLPPARTFGPGARPLTWKEHLGVLRHEMESDGVHEAPHWPPGREILYVVDPPSSIHHRGLIIEAHCRDPRKRGGFTLPRRLGLRRSQLGALPDPI